MMMMMMMNNNNDDDNDGFTQAHNSLTDKCSQRPMIHH